MKRKCKTNKQAKKKKNHSISSLGRKIEGRNLDGKSNVNHTILKYKGLKELYM